jgi:hypothetical protein
MAFMNFGFTVLLMASKSMIILETFLYMNNCKPNSWTPQVHLKIQCETLTYTHLRFTGATTGWKTSLRNCHNRVGQWPKPWYPTYFTPSHKNGRKCNQWIQTDQTEMCVHMYIVCVCVCKKLHKNTRFYYQTEGIKNTFRNCDLEWHATHSVYVTIFLL